MRFRASKAARFAALGLVISLSGPVALSLAARAQAQTDPFDAQIEQARTALESAQADAHAAADRLEATRAHSTQVQARIQEVQANIRDLEVQIPALQAHARQVRQVLHERAAALYSSGGPAAVYGPLAVAPSLAHARRKILADAAARADHNRAAELENTATKLDAAERQLQAEQIDLAKQQTDLVALQAQLEAQQAEVDQRVAAANAALERAKVLGALRARGEPVLGPTVLTGAQMAAWIQAKSYKPRLETTIEDLANIYVEEGNAEGLRGDLAFAQSVVETGGFASSPDNNFAGLGWCDSCGQGTRFPTPRDGVRAQVQHLKNYADATSLAAGLAHPPSPYWYSADPVIAAHKFDTFFAKGWAPTWNDMGHGNWATDKAYSGKVLKVYADMVAFARTGSV